MTLSPIAICSGEPAGIGPELCLRLYQKKFSAPLVVLADKNMLLERASLLGLHDLKIHDYQLGQDVLPDGLNVYHLPLAQRSVAGQPVCANSNYVLSLLDCAIDGCQSGLFSAMVTAPVHKGIINDSGLFFQGHTEYLAEKTDTDQVVMMLAGEIQNTPSRDLSGFLLRVALATTHLPLAEVPHAITPQLFESVLLVLVRDLKQKFAIAEPKILVAGINPHAGENGHFGREEIEVLEPVLKRLRQQGLQLIGPLPADTLFTPSVLMQGDAVLAMFHDQGLAVLKYATFGHGVNITLGLPFIRTSVDHGTAFDLAGSGQASPESLYVAIEQAIAMSVAVNK